MAGISLKGATEHARQEIPGDKNITVHGFEQREIGPFVVNVLYYSYEWRWDDGLSGTTYRAQMFVNGQATMGTVL